MRSDTGNDFLFVTADVFERGGTVIKRGIIVCGIVILGFTVYAPAAIGDPCTRCNATGLVEVECKRGGTCHDKCSACMGRGKTGGVIGAWSAGCRHN